MNADSMRFFFLLSCYCSYCCLPLSLSLSLCSAVVSRERREEARKKNFAHSLFSLANRTSFSVRSCLLLLLIAFFVSLPSVLSLSLSSLVSSPSRSTAGERERFREGGAMILLQQQQRLLHCLPACLVSPAASCVCAFYDFDPFHHFSRSFSLFSASLSLAIPSPLLLSLLLCSRAIHTHHALAYGCF